MVGFETLHLGISSDYVDVCHTGFDGDTECKPLLSHLAHSFIKLRVFLNCCPYFMLLVPHKVWAAISKMHISEIQISGWLCQDGNMARVEGGQLET